MWMSTSLKVAGAYNMAWAFAMVFATEPVIAFLGLTAWSQSAPLLFLGLATGVMGLGYLLAASDPVRHWPVVLMGLLSKVGSAIGVCWLIFTGALPNSAWRWAVINDVVWMVPFGMILAAAYEKVLGCRRMANPEVLKLALRRKTQDGVTIDELSRLSPVLLVFLRHAGCTFCREALSDLARHIGTIDAAGTRLVLVHMGTDKSGERFFSRYGLENVQRISDPERCLYRAFGLPRGGFAALFGPKVWIRGFQAGVLKRHGFGQIVDDIFQMPGAFLLFHGEVLRSYRHQSAADRPDYMALVHGTAYASPELRG